MKREHYIVVKLSLIKDDLSWFITKAADMMIMQVKISKHKNQKYFQHEQAYTFDTTSKQLLFISASIQLIAIQNN